MSTRQELFYDYRSGSRFHILSFYYFRKIQNRSIWHIAGALLGTTTPRQSGPESNGNKKGDSKLPSFQEMEFHYQYFLYPAENSHFSANLELQRKQCI